MGAGDELGSLARELEGWSGDEFGEGEEDFGEPGEEILEGEEGDAAAAQAGMTALPPVGEYNVDGARDSGIVVSSPSLASVKNGIMSPTKNLPPRLQQQRYLHDEGYSEDEESELDEAEVKITTAELEARIAAVESLARRGLDGGRGGDAIRESERGLDEVGRFVDALRDLGAQSGLELTTSRYASFSTAHPAPLQNDSLLTHEPTDSPPPTNPSQRT